MLHSFEEVDAVTTEFKFGNHNFTIAFVVLLTSFLNLYNLVMLQFSIAGWDLLFRLIERSQYLVGFLLCLLLGHQVEEVVVGVNGVLN